MWSRGKEAAGKLSSATPVAWSWLTLATRYNLVIIGYVSVSVECHLYRFSIFLVP